MQEYLEGEKYNFPQLVFDLYQIESEMRSLSKIRIESQMFLVFLNELKGSFGKGFDYAAIQKMFIHERKAKIEELHKQVVQCWSDKLHTHTKCGRSSVRCDGTDRTKALHFLVHNLLDKAEKSKDSTPISFGVLGSWGLGKTTCKLELKQEIAKLFKEGRDSVIADDKNRGTHTSPTMQSIYCVLSALVPFIKGLLTTKSHSILSPIKYVSVDCNAWVYDGSESVWASLLLEIWNTCEQHYGAVHFRTLIADLQDDAKLAQQQDPPVSIKQYYQISRNRKKVLTAQYPSTGAVLFALEQYFADYGKNTVFKFISDILLIRPIVYVSFNFAKKQLKSRTTQLVLTLFFGVVVFGLITMAIFAARCDLPWQDCDEDDHTPAKNYFLGMLAFLPILGSQAAVVKSAINYFLHDPHKTLSMDTSGKGVANNFGLACQVCSVRSLIATV